MPSSAVKATFADNALVVSFLSAETPRVWRVDMGRFLSTVLQIEEKQGKFSLMMKPAGAPAEEIGSFSDKKEAAEALRIITDAMLRGKGKSLSSGGWGKRILKIFVVLLVAFVLISAFGKARLSHQGDAVQAPAVQTGVPTPADQIFDK